MNYILFVFSIIALLLCANVQAVDKSACSQPQEVGPCRKADPKFSYNSEKKACEQFFYGGCQGNDNRFDTKEECEKICL
ncbi:PREDICTED: protease inhibitor-like [Rhagoletis zephyria]|uniref:protease inhibitor-like n=1 Tax=Rhagoletis zephyria TaxID=28612 RepID=UPI00081128C0|nr:PREDICTED: protease inhibitor-like [Rhagoletis zephyria]